MSEKPRARKRSVEPEDRAQAMVDIRRNARRGFKEVTKKKNDRVPGEVAFKKRIALTLKIAGYSHTQIAKQIGETRGTVGAWMKEPDVQEEFTAITQALGDAALVLLESYSIEAINALVEIIRHSTDDGSIIKAADSILDRIVGLGKKSRAEVHRVSEEKHTLTDEGIRDQLRSLSPEDAEKAAQLLEGLENMLSDVEG